MKITAVKTKTYLYPYKEGEEFANGIRWNRARSCVLVIVETDEGITGYGESDSAGAPPEVTACIVEKYIGPLVIGMDPMCVEAVWSHVYSHCDKNGRRGMAIAAFSISTPDGIPRAFMASASAARIFSGVERSTWPPPFNIL